MRLVATGTGVWKRIHLQGQRVAPFARIAFKGSEKQQYAQLQELVSSLENRTRPTDPGTYASMLEACAKLKALSEGKRVHAFIVEDKYEHHRLLVSNLIVMYGKCGQLDDAQKLLERMHQGSVFSWTAMINACTQHGENVRALQLFEQMVQADLKPTCSGLIALVNACATLKDLETGRKVHAQISDRDFQDSSVLGNALISMYSRCGSLEDATEAFHSLPCRHVVTWNAMISAYVRHEKKREALECFRTMEREGVVPNNVTYMIILSCSGILSEEELESIHQDIIRYGLEDDDFVGTVLVDMYGKCGRVEDAWKVFNNMHSTSVITWTAMLSGLAHNGLVKEAFQLFRTMHREGIRPSEVTFAAVLNACTVWKPAEIQGILDQLGETSFMGDNILGTALLSTYARCNDLRQARVMFDRIQKADVISWNAMVAAYLQHSHYTEAFLLFEQMLLAGLKPTALTFISLLTACADAAAITRGKAIYSYASELGLDSEVALANAFLNIHGKCGNLKDAREVFERMAQKDLVSWNSMLAAYGQHGCGREALQLFQRMEAENVKPNSITFVTVLDANTSRTTVAEGRQIHARVVANGLETDQYVQNALLNMYAKCGNLDDAQAIFDKSENRDVFSWTTLVAGYAQHGHAETALKLFKKMQQDGVRPNQITFISALAACNHAGRLEEGCELFSGMKDDHGLPPTSKHFGCLVDLLGRCGRLREAESLIRRMPFEADVVAWMALLGACKNNTDVDRGQRCADRILELEPHFASAYIVLANLYSAAGRWSESANIRKIMLEKGVRSDPGCSAVEVDNELHTFVTGDKNHPKAEEIYVELEKLISQIKEAGYVPDTEQVVHNVTEEHKERLLLRHSEKVAIAFGLMSTPSGTPLKVIKNLRVCSDCHTASKFISKVFGREIVMRDSSRYHHFSDGVCSCGDYW